MSKERTWNRTDIRIKSGIEFLMSRSQLEEDEEEERIVKSSGEIG